MADTADLLVERFAHVERVVADPLRFKLRLGIGEDAFASLKIKKTLQELWDVGGMAATGASLAASKAVASTFFASGSVLSLLGLGVAVTPIGWVAAAALASGGAYFGVTRLFQSYAGNRIETVPKFINTPLDLLAASLMDLMGSLAVKVAQIDGRLDDVEKEVIARHFVSGWGFDPAYIESALEVILAGAGQGTIRIFVCGRA